jgi:UDP-glucose 4-epimerase
MNILVIGASGLTGKKLIYQLNQNHKVFAGYYANEITKAHNIEPLKIDLRNLNFEKLPGQVDVIYYLAQSKEYRDFPGGATDMLDINAVVPVKLLQHYSDKGLKQFIYASTGSVYTDTSIVLKEDVQINPEAFSGFYAFSKYTGEKAVRFFEKLIPSIVIARPFFIFGESQSPTMLIPSIIEKIKSGEKVFVNGEEGFKLNPIYAEDAASKFEKLLAFDTHGTFNIAGDEEISFKDLIKLISGLTGKEAVIEYKEGPVNNLVADNTNFQKLSGFKCAPLRESLKKIMDTYE